MGWEIRESLKGKESNGSGVRIRKRENSHCGSEKFSFKAIKTFIATTKNVENVSGRLAVCNIFT